jgi:hypothetical protein
MTLQQAMPCVLVDKYQCFGKTDSIQFQDRRLSLDGTGSSQTSAPIYGITRHHISEDRNLKRNKPYVAQHFDMVKFQVLEIF